MTTSVHTDNSGNLFNHIIATKQLKNDSALARLLEVAPPVISKIRHHRVPVGASLMIRVHEATELSIAEIKHLIAGGEL